ncbi:MAG: hypothetical protein KatS3mg113_0475 [Planctomycetaceae bacterium]|nr:MAG: hypothetical protein KatS3mg113_0475 [Planctomycetaceae bacterium]
MKHVPSSTGLVLRAVLGLLIIGASWLGWYYFVTRDTAFPEPPRLTPDQQEALRARIEEENRLCAERDRQAIQTCLERIHAQFESYHQRVPILVEDLLSYSTRLQFAKELASDWWNNRLNTHQSTARQLAIQKISHHLFTKQDLIDGLSWALNAFRDDLQANQRFMLVQLKLSMDELHIPGVFPNEAQFISQVWERLVEGVLGQMEADLHNWVVTLVVSEVGATLFQFTVMPVIDAMLGELFSTTVGSSLLGPLGGLVVGFAIDGFMCEHYKTKLNRELHNYLSQVETSMLLGTQRQRGVSQSLALVCEQLAKERPRLIYEYLSEGRRSLMRKWWIRFQRLVYLTHAELVSMFGTPNYKWHVA